MSKQNYTSKSTSAKGVSRKEKLKRITEKLEAGVREMFTSEQYAKWLKTMRTFHNYSFNNTLLIALQAPNATQVASYETWKKLNRQVRKGEKGIKILVPTPVKIQTEKERIDSVTSKPVLDADGNPVKDIEERYLQRFKIGHVFAYEQTDGEPLPELGVNELTGTVNNYSALREAITMVSPVPIRFDAIEDGAKGYLNASTKEIVIKKDMSELQTIKTMLHELAHAICHSRIMQIVANPPKDRQTMEVEAESIAYTVCQYFGLDTSDYSFSYVTGWSTGRDLKTLQESMDFIRGVSDDLINDLSAEMEKRLPKKERSVLYQLEALKEKSGQPKPVVYKEPARKVSEAVL